MPTTKKRINITVPENIDTALQQLSKRDNTSVASKALELLTNAMEMEEDEIVRQISEKRDTENAIFVSNKAAWK